MTLHPSHPLVTTAPCRCHFTGLAFTREASGENPRRRPGSVTSWAGAGSLSILLQTVRGLPWATLGMGGPSAGNVSCRRSFAGHGVLAFRTEHLPHLPPLSPSSTQLSVRSGNSHL